MSGQRDGQKTTGGRRRSREQNKIKERREERKKGVCHSRLISVRFASVTAPSAGSSHANRQAIWLHYETHTNKHKPTHTTHEDTPASMNMHAHTQTHTHRPKTCERKLKTKERGAERERVVSCIKCVFLPHCELMQTHTCAMNHTEHEFHFKTVNSTTGNNGCRETLYILHNVHTRVYFT